MEVPVFEVHDYECFVTILGHFECFYDADL